jgi:hypothetical protein
MNPYKNQPSKNRRDIGEVVFPIEKLMAAREISSCCVGVEAALENNSKLITARTSGRVRDFLKGLCSRAF